MQIKTGTASVTNGSNRVIFATADLSAATLQAFFSLDAVIGAPLYPIIDIQKPAAAGGSWTNSASSKWEMFLAVNYAQATNATAAFLIQKDFTVPVGLRRISTLATFEVTDTQDAADLQSQRDHTHRHHHCAIGLPLRVWNAD